MYTKITNEMMEQIRKGDVKLRGDIIEENLNLIYYVVNKHYATSGLNRCRDMGIDDVYQICVEHALKNLDKYDPDRTKLSTFLGYITIMKVRNLMRESNSKKIKILTESKPIDQPVSNQDEINLTLADILSYTDYNLQALEIKDLLSRIEFTENESKLLDIMIKNGSKNQKSLANALDLSQPYVSRLKLRVENKIIHALENFDEIPPITKRKPGGAVQSLISFISNNKEKLLKVKLTTKQSEVINLIIENPNITVTKICKETGTSKGNILRFLKRIINRIEESDQNADI